MIKPKLHYTASKGWINDPNGLVFDEYTKTYHLFAQYSKHIENDGIFGWIHATSKDLISWTEKDIPVLSNSKGDAWSGGAVIDYKNTSGLFNESVPSGSRMVLFVTYQTDNPKIGILYSLDHGETWIEYDKFIILNEDNKYSKDFRDPKVIWYENEELPKGGKWLLIAGVPTVKLFSSDNLVDWDFESEILDVNGNTVSSECPDILKMSLEDDPNNVKYVISTAGTSYIVGNLSLDKGKIVFRGEQSAKKMFFGPKLWTCRGELYATQSFFNDKFDRTILMSWIVDRTAALVEGKVWNGAESLPLEAKLKSKDGEMILNLYPVEELNNYRERATRSPAGGKHDIEIEFDVSKSNGFQIELSECSSIIYDAKQKTITYDEGFSEATKVSEAVKPINGNLKLRIIVDEPIVEIYVNGGESNLHGLIFSGNHRDFPVFKAKDSSEKPDNFVIYSLK